MTLSAIVAFDLNHAIGKDGGLPWHLPDDLKFFKKTTLGKPVLMGRKTFESLRKPLPGRLNIVLSRQDDLQLPEGVVHVCNLEEGLEKMRMQEVEECFIIGGGKVFEETMDLIDRIYVTVVKTEVKHADTFFPKIDHSHWKIVWEETHEADEKHAYPFTFQQLERTAL